MRAAEIAQPRSPAIASVVLSIVVLAIVLAGCGGSDGEVGRLRAWRASDFYIPPPPPGRTARTPVAVTDAAPAAEAESSRHAAPTVEGDTPAAGAPSDAEVRQELKQAFKGATGTTSLVNAAALTPQGYATVPPSAPAKVAAMINAGNQVARKPYVYGGGHGGGPEGLFIDSAYDCSGSVSFALAAAGFIRSPMDSTALEHFGKPGPGRWVTIYANAGHAWMTVAGLRFDTSGRSERGSRWQAASRGTGGFVLRHPPGL